MDRRAPLSAGEAGVRRLLLTIRKAVVDLLLTRAGWTDHSHRGWAGLSGRWRQLTLGSSVCGGFRATSEALTSEALGFSCRLGFDGPGEDRTHDLRIKVEVSHSGHLGRSIERSL